MCAYDKCGCILDSKQISLIVLAVFLSLGQILHLSELLLLFRLQFTDFSAATAVPVITELITAPSHRCRVLLAIMGSYTQPTAHPLSIRPTYTDDQLTTYLEALQCQPKLVLSDVRASGKRDPLSTLATLQRLTTRLIAWGSLGLHYSPHRVLSLEPNALFTKIVERRQGGYCMEDNTFFATVLRSLGYEYYLTGARISATLASDAQGPERDGFMGFGHQVLLVKLEGQRYLVDVGLGAQGSHRPIKLQEGAMANGSPGVTLRLVRRGLADFTCTDEGQKLWVLEFKTWKRVEDEPKNAEMGTTDGWNGAYAFGEGEWNPQDFNALNFNQSTNPRSWFVKMLIVTQPILSDDGQRSLGQLTLVNGEFSRRMLNKKTATIDKEILRDCSTEEERVEGLEKWFGIILRDDERNGIKGLVSEIKPKPKMDS